MTTTAKSSAIRLITVLTLTFALLAAFCTTAMAANVCSQVSGNSANDKSFVVSTAGKWYSSPKLTFTQTKGTLSYKNIWGTTKSMSSYDNYYISCYNATKNKTTSYKMTGSSKTVKLDKNSRYVITVKKGDLNEIKLKASNLLALRFVDKWSKYPTWTVKTTKNVDGCTIAK